MGMTLKNKASEREISLELFETLRCSNNWYEIVKMLLERVSSSLQLKFCGILLPKDQQLSVHLSFPIGLNMLDCFKAEYCREILKYIDYDLDAEDVFIDMSDASRKNVVTTSTEDNVKLLLYPMKDKTGVIGLFGTTYSGKDTLEGGKAIEFITTQITMVMGIASLYQRLDEVELENEERFRQISQIGSLIGVFTDLDRLLTQYLELSLRMVVAEVGSIMLYDESGDWVTRVDLGLSHNMITSLRTNSHERVVDILKNEEHPVILSIEDTDYSVMNETHLLHFETFLTVPLRVKEGKLIGALNIVNAPMRRISEPTLLGLLSTIAGIAATLIENAQLYQENLKRQQMEKEIQLARSIQQSLLPEELPIIDDIKFAAMSEPAKQVGGDYYDYVRFDEDRIGIVIADVAGKGIPAALMMTTLRAFLKAYTEEFHTPLETVNFLNKQITRDIADDRFITLFYLVIERKKRKIIFCNAGHDPMIIYHPSKDIFNEVDTDGMPLGIFESNKFEEKELNVDKGDIVIIYTDGVIEAKNTKREEFGFDKLKDIIRKNAHLLPEEIKIKVLSEVMEFAKGMPQHDDITIVIMKFL